MPEYLHLSSLHLTDNDADLLEVESDRPAIRSRDHENGVTVLIAGFTGRLEHVALRVERLREAGFSDGFVDIVRWAGRRKAWSVRFDERGELHPDFAVGGWTPPSVSPRI